MSDRKILEKIQSTFKGGWHNFRERLRTASYPHLAISVIFMIAALSVFPSLYANYGISGGAVLLVPVMLNGWFMGVLGGLIGSIILVATLYFIVPGYDSFLHYFVGLLPALLITLMFGPGTGWVSKLLKENKMKSAELLAEREALLQQMALREKAEAEIQQLNAVLEERVKRRTLELEEKNIRLVELMDAQKVIEEQLRINEENFRQLSSNIDDAIWLTDLKTSKQLYSSPAGERLYNLPLSTYDEDLMAWTRLLHPDDRGRMDNAIRGFYEENLPVDIEYRVILDDGTLKWIWTRISPVRDEQGVVVRFAGVSKDITQRKQAEAQIMNSLREKEVLLKEIHHRVKNNLQVISSLLNLASARIEDAENRQIFKESQHRVYSMALIHEKLYQSKDLFGVDFDNYISNLCNFLIRSYRKEQSDVELKLEVQDVHLNLDTAIPCGLILNELVTNSLKYAFRDDEPGEIRIAFRRTSEHECCLEVSDTGPGLAFEIDDLPKNSLGLVLVNTLVDQLDGALQIDNTHGAKFSITFPIPKV